VRWRCRDFLFEEKGGLDLSVWSELKEVERIKKENGLFFGQTSL
jgi:hypothetical protein